jgi:hypothetical protein
VRVTDTAKLAARLAARSAGSMVSPGVIIVNFSLVVDGALLRRMVGSELGSVVVGTRTTGVLVGSVVPLGDFDVLGDTDGEALGNIAPGWRLRVGRLLGT